MSEPRPVPLPLKHRLYLAVAKKDASAIALVEARDEAEAATRVAYVVGQLGMADWDEVEVRLAQGYMSRVPTFLDGFFQARRGQSTSH
jgi:carbohydrate-selective porin OprB